MSNFLEKELRDARFDVKTITDEVTIVEDFLSKDDLDSLFDIINNTSQEDWEVEYLGNMKSFCMEKFGRDDVENLVAEGKFEITQNWKDKNYNISHEDIYKEIYDRLNVVVESLGENLNLSGLATIQRMQEGVELKAHTDQHTDPAIRYAAIVYLNDDYVDGELFFPNKDLQLKPKPGSLVIFPGNNEYNHGVRHVGKGPIRYVLVAFIKVIKFYENNKY